MPTPAEGDPVPRRPEPESIAERRRSRVWLKYLVLQVPGWLFLVLIFQILRSRTEFPGWMGVSLLILWVLKDLALYPLLRRSYEEDPRSGAERLVGMAGETVTPLIPQGYIRVRGELWKAKLESPDESMPEGTQVSVIGAERLLLTVRRN